MKQSVSKRIEAYILFLTFWLVSCQQMAAQLAYQPPGIPLKITVNSWGEVEIEASGEVVTPIGTFEAGLVADPAHFFDGVQNTLVVRIGNQECWYDLNGQDFNVQLSPGYYEQINLRKDRDNIYLELQGSGTAVNSCVQKPVTVARLQQTQPVVCEGASPSHLAVGDEAVIAVFQAAVHQSPGESIPLVRNKYLARDRIVTIVEGPVCAERVLFWKIHSEEITFSNGQQGIIIGWVAEESGDIYLLHYVD